MQCVKLYRNPSTCPLILATNTGSRKISEIPLAVKFPIMGDIAVSLPPQAPEAQRAHIPTDSMVTVRLSDAQNSPDIEDNDDQPTKETLVSRRQSLASQSSNGSETSDRSSLVSVDWDELERTEEQEPRSENADEVSEDA